jgi:Concanavalin A-like lectin/glucanases superfamily
VLRLSIIFSVFFLILNKNYKEVKMKNYSRKYIIVYSMFLILGTTLFNNKLNAAEPEWIFDWNVFVDTAIDGITPVPKVGFTTGDWMSLYDYQDANNGINGLMLLNSTGPYDGSSDTQVLDTVMDYIDTNGYYLDFVFADFESTTEDENCEEMVDQVRAHSNSTINSAYIGNYGEYPGATDYSESRGNYDRTARHNFYVNSGMDIAMPPLYPRTAYRNHAVRDDLHADLCVSIAHALFWTPLERFTIAKNALPVGHVLIPWMGGLVDNPGYVAPIPTKTECRSLLKHVRLRGADGYYTWSHGDNTNYTDWADYYDDMYANAWEPLDWFFDYPGKEEILNLTTNKTGGIEWSGIRRGNRCLFVFSNYTSTSAQIDLPDNIENIPDMSPSIASGEHFVMDYVVGPLTQWKLDENTGSTAANEMAGSVDGNITGTVWVSGKSGSALSFDGVDDGVNMGDVLDLGSSDRSISLWFKTSDTTSVSRCILSKGYSTTGNQHSIYLVSSGELYALMDISGTDRVVRSNITVNDGQWHHIALTIERDDFMKMYLDGELTSSTDISMDSAVDAQNSYNFYIGRTFKNDGQPFPGSIDEVKIFTGVLSAQEVLDDYACTFNSLLDERQGTSIKDDSIYSHAGTLSGGAVWENGKFGSALTFDGIDDNIAYGDVLDLGTEDRTVAMWFKTTATGIYKVLISKGYSSTSNAHSIFLYNGTLCALMDISGTDRIANSGSKVVDDGNWHHVILTIDRDDAMKMYVDGEVTGTVDISADSAIDSQSTYGFYIGRSHKGQYFPGSIDEVKIYKQALSATQVDDLYESYK